MPHSKFRPVPGPAIPGSDRRVAPEMRASIEDLNEQVRGCRHEVTEREGRIRSLEECNADLIEEIGQLQLQVAVLGQQFGHH